jgi:uncharacterized protein (TIGR04255 family)
LFDKLSLCGLRWPVQSVSILRISLNKDLSVKIPKKLAIVPILEAIFEIRFESSSPEDTNLGVIYNAFKDNFSSPISLPVMNLSADIRSNDESFKFQPYQRMTSNDGKYLLQYGQRVLSLHCVNYKYDVWDNFQVKINELTTKLIKLNIVSTINRIGLRYIDFMNAEEINGYKFEDLNINIDIAGMKYGENFSCSTIFKAKIGNHKTQIFKSIQITHETKIRIGDMIDIDTSFESVVKDLSQIESKLPEVHEEQKKIFFGILGENVVKLLGPTYE